MAPKKQRRVSSANIDRKGGRVGREVDKLVADQEKLDFQTDLDGLVEEVTNNPSKLKRLKAVMQADKPPDWDPSTHFDPSWARLKVGRAPPKFLTDAFLPLVPKCPPKEALQGLLKANNKQPLQMLKRMCVISDYQQFGPTCKADWLRIFQQRATQMKYDFDTLVFNRGTYLIDWGAPWSGHFTLLPVLPDQTEPDSHVYKEVLGKSICFGPPLCSSSDAVTSRPKRPQQKRDHFP